MNKLKLIIKEKGRYITIPGITPFRTPAELDVSRIKLSILVQSLHSCGVSDYEIISSGSNGIEKFTQDDFKHNENEIKLNDRLDKLETLLSMLISAEKTVEKDTSSEQINKRLGRIEKMLVSKDYIKESLKREPLIEELENDRYIPTIDISDMKISGKTTEVLDKKDDKEIDDAVDLLSNLRK